MSLRRARAEIDAGEVVCIFAEGAISRTGRLLPFKRGFEKVVEGANVPIIPVHLDQTVGQHLQLQRRPIFLEAPEAAALPRDRVLWRAAACERQRAGSPASRAGTGKRSGAPPARPAAICCTRKFIRVAKRRWFAFCMADTTGTELTCGKTLIGARLDRKLGAAPLGRRVDGRRAASRLGRRRAGEYRRIAGRPGAGESKLHRRRRCDALAIEQCGIKTILTSRVFLSKAGLEELPGMVYLEELRKTFTARSETVDAVDVAACCRRADWIALYQKSKTGRPRHGDFLQRQHRRAQGNHAVASQHHLQHRRHRAGDSIHARGPHHGCAAAVSLFRLHRHALAAAARRLSARFTIPIRPTPKPSAKP